MSKYIGVSMMLLVILAQVSDAAKSHTGYARLIQGPMVGAVDEDEFRIWGRLSGNFPLQIEYDTDPDFGNPQRSEVEQALKENDFTVTVRVKNLQADTQYYYRLVVNGGQDTYLKQTFTCKTAPAGPAKFSVGFGSCIRSQQDPHQEIWSTVEALNPDLFFWLGDNIYGDSLEPIILADEYRRQREILNGLKVLRNIPHLAVWDDHDYGLNDHDRTSPIKMQALEVFKQYWANPAYGTADAPGCFFQYHYGGVDFFFLDVRYHRDPNDAPNGPEKTMLGAEQLQWLKDGLQASETPFKVLVSGSGFAKGKGPEGDSWSAFLHERDHLFGFIQEEEIPGVILLSGDTHIGELNAIPRSEQGGYDLYDLVSSPLGQRPGGVPYTRFPERRIRQAYVESENVGLLEFDLTLDDPVLRFNLYNLENEPVWDWFEIKASELTNGVSSWEAKMDAVSLQRYQNQQAGGEYYEER